MDTKKELKEAYKQLKPEMGIFQLKNLINNRILVDNATDIGAKCNRHMSELRFGSHRNRALQNDWNEHGADNFKFEILSKLQIDEDGPTDYNKELKTLQSMVIEDIQGHEADMY